MAIIRIKDANGEWQEVPAVTGVGGIPKAGNRGLLAGYELVGTSAIISDASNDSCQASSDITIVNGVAGTAWTKIVRVTSEVDVTIGDKWNWVTGEVPTIVAGGILVCTWCGDGGIVSFLSPSA